MCFGVPRFSVQRSPNPYFEGFRSDLGQKSGAPQTQIRRPRIQRPILGPLKLRTFRGNFVLQRRSQKNTIPQTHPSSLLTRELKCLSTTCPFWCSFIFGIASSSLATFGPMMGTLSLFKNLLMPFFLMGCFEIRVFRACFRAPFLLPFFPNSSPLFPLSGPVPPLFPSSPPPLSSLV